MQAFIDFGWNNIWNLKFEATDNTDHVWESWSFEFRKNISLWKVRNAYVDGTCTGCTIRAIRARIFTLERGRTSKKTQEIILSFRRALRFYYRLGGTVNSTGSWNRFHWLLGTSETGSLIRELAAQVWSVHCVCETLVPRTSAPSSLIPQTLVPGTRVR